jgi:translation initiation factor IF-3
MLRKLKHTKTKKRKEIGKQLMTADLEKVKLSATVTDKDIVTLLSNYRKN